jgi:MYXO-CTERM domain-containing protein
MDMDGEVAPTPLAQPRTVLLITGVTIPGEWFDPIKLRLERDGFRPVVYEPPELLSGDLEDNAQRLAQVVADIEAQTGETRIDILAECTGGVIARRYIQAMGGDEHVRSLVTFISPQHGLPKAPLAKSFVGWDALDDLTPDSPFMHLVNDPPLAADVPVTSIYTCTDEYIQPYETSIIPGATNIGLACDGTEFIGHFQFFYDPSIYLVMHDALVQPAPHDQDPQDPSTSDPTMPSDDPTTDPTAPDDNLDAGGCSTGGSSDAELAVLALGMMVALRRRQRRS